MADLLFGVETEYAIAGMSPSGAIDRGQILHSLMEFARQQLVHLPDLNSHGSVFLQNGSRFYVDCGSHPEICTPECTNPWDVVRYTQAGHGILANLVSAVGAARMPGAEIMCFRCNVDYSGSQTTWGCHESYLHRAPLDTLQPQIIPHLVTRLVYTGAGGFSPLSRGLEFTLSPRVAHFQQVVSGGSTSERGIWHTKTEPLCAGYRRLHIICGESLCSETAAFLKAGATALIVALADAGLAPGRAVQLAEPLEALQNVAGDVTCKRPLAMADGSRLTAIAIQRRYLEQAEAHLGARFMPAWAAEVCRRWRAVLDQLEDAPGSVEQTLDWGIKLALYAHHARSMGIRWDALPFWNQVIDRLAGEFGDGEKPLSLAFIIGPNSPIPQEVASLAPLVQSRGFRWQDLKALLDSRQKLFEIDTRFGQLGPKGIFQALDLAGALNHRVSGVDNIDQAMAQPPAAGRARVRGQVIQRLARADDLRCDWQRIVNFQENQILDLTDPFASEESWRPLGRADRRLLQMDGPFFQGGGNSGSADCHSRRQAAVDRILSGDYAGAETLIRGLVQEGFMLPSTYCHLARVLLMTDREGEAREQISQAWTIREEASAYVVPRILFFQCIFSMFDGAAINTIVGQIKGAMCDPAAHLDWTVQPMLDHLRARLGETNYQFLKALAEALCGASAMPRLDEFPQWRNVIGSVRR